MAGIRLYSGIYVALLVLATLKYAFFEFMDYWLALGLTFVAATIKIGLIAAYFQHLRYEPRSISYIMLAALFAVLLLAMAASYSIL